jgi:hypothetical protein
MRFRFTAASMSRGAVSECIVAVITRNSIDSCGDHPAGVVVTDRVVADLVYIARAASATAFGCIVVVATTATTSAKTKNRKRRRSGILRLFDMADLPGHDFRPVTRRTP